MAVKIVVLDDGETWSGDAQIMTITQEAYEKLCEGEKVSDLTDADILDISTFGTDTK